MNPHTKPAPRGFHWADRPVGRAIVTVLAIVSLSLSLFVGYRYVELIDCLKDRAVADATRTKAVADAADRERAADLALISGVRPGGPDAAELRRESVAARRHTDEVRAANPAPAPGKANCG